MYFYSRTGDTHNDISTQSTEQQYSYSDKYIEVEYWTEVWGDLDYVSVLLNTYLNWN